MTILSVYLVAGLDDTSPATGSSPTPAGDGENRVDGGGTRRWSSRRCCGGPSAATARRRGRRWPGWGATTSRNGAYVVGAIARTGSPFSGIIRELGVSKQAAGQLVDTLVIRGYLIRTPDPEDRRRMTVTLTERGRLAAEAAHGAVEEVDPALIERVGAATWPPRGPPWARWPNWVPTEGGPDRPAHRQTGPGARARSARAGAPGPRPA